MKLLLVALHDTTASVVGSSTMSYVLVRNGGGPPSWSASIGLGWPLAVTADDRLSTLTEFIIPWFMQPHRDRLNEHLTSARSRNMYRISVHLCALAPEMVYLMFARTGCHLPTAKPQRLRDTVQARQKQEEYGHKNKVQGSSQVDRRNNSVLSRALQYC